MPTEVIAERQFSVTDQNRFAAVSGDRNPIHMDEVVARRTLAGFPVVHGIHTLLWSLDSLFGYLPNLAPVSSIQARFQKMIYVGDDVQLILTHVDEYKLRAEVVVETTKATSIQLNIGGPKQNSEYSSDEPIFRNTEPLAPSFSQMINSHGRVLFSSLRRDDLCRMFPTAARVLGAQRVTGLACSSYVVGMVCPGFHSLYAGLNFFVTSPRECDHDTLQFRVTANDIRFRLITLDISGAGWMGSVDAYARPEPVRQAKMHTISTKVKPGEFSGTSALVVGGSRGLGELIAKIIAAGGGQVTLTYAVGLRDARRVQTEIVSNGGICEIIQYNVNLNPKKQLDQLPRTPNELYYLASPPIFPRKRSLFSRERLNEFMTFYVTCFYELCKELRSRSTPGLKIFYPSSISVNDRPANMTEYSMAKAAGEVLCADMQSFENFGPILVRRLPRLSTDQTATLLEVEEIDSIDIILPIVREVHLCSNAHS